MASASIHYIPVSKEITERLAAARKAVLARDADMLKAAALPYPSFSGQVAKATVVPTALPEPK